MKDTQTSSHQEASQTKNMGRVARSGHPKDARHGTDPFPNKKNHRAHPERSDKQKKSGRKAAMPPVKTQRDAVAKTVSNNFKTSFQELLKVQTNQKAQITQKGLTTHPEGLFVRLSARPKGAAASSALRRSFLDCRLFRLVSSFVSGATVGPRSNAGTTTR